jgi:hypothetical protein
VQPSPPELRPFIGLLYYLRMMDGENFGAINDRNE